MKFSIENTCAKLISRIYKPGTLDLKVREDYGAEKNYYIQGVLNSQPSTPMIIRRPIDFNTENIIAVANGTKIMMIDKGKLMNKVAENIKGTEELNKNLQIP